MNNVSSKGFTFLVFSILIFSAVLAGICVFKPACDGDFGRHSQDGSQIFGEKNIPMPGAGKYFPWMDIYVGFVESTLPFLTVKKISFFVYLTCGYLFFLILNGYKNELGTFSSWVPLGILMAHPVVIIAGGNSGDYIYSLFWILCAWQASLKGWSGIAGILLAFASGFRLSNAAWIAPLAILLYRRHSLKQAIDFFLTATIAGYLVWHSYFLRAGTLNPLVIFAGASDYAGHLSFGLGLKSMVSKIIHLIGLTVLLYTVLVFRKIGFGRIPVIVKRCPEIPVALLLFLGIFLFMPYDFGYLITILPVLCLLWPTFGNDSHDSVRLVLVFCMNFIVLGLQFQIPSKFHLSHGYWTAEVTCQSCTTVFEKLRFSIPHDVNNELLSPPGDWAARSDVCS